MDNPLYAMLFAEDLVSYILYKYGIDWPPQQGIRRFRTEIGKTRFCKEIGEAVFLAAEYHREEVWNGYNILRSRCWPVTDMFQKEAAITTIMQLPNGYDPWRYIMLSASLAGLSAYFYEEDPKIADVSAQLLAYIINFYILHRAFDPKTRYFELAYESQKFRRKYLAKFDSRIHEKNVEGLIDESSRPPKPGTEEVITRREFWRKAGNTFLMTQTAEMSKSDDVAEQLTKISKNDDAAEQLTKISKNDDAAEQLATTTKNDDAAEQLAKTAKNDDAAEQLAKKSTIDDEAEQYEDLNDLNENDNLGSADDNEEIEGTKKSLKKKKKNKRKKK